MTSVVEEPVLREPTLDDPTVAHVREIDVYEDGDALTALCGKRLFGIEVHGNMDVCQRCVELLRKEYGDIEIGEQGWRPR